MERSPRGQGLGGERGVLALWVYSFVQEWSGLEGLSHMGQDHQILMYRLKAQFIIFQKEYAGMQSL